MKFNVFFEYEIFINYDKHNLKLVHNLEIRN